jgi:cytochrome P450
MPYIRAIILEVMRHAPIIAPPPPRRATYEVEYGNYRIPAGTCLFFNLYPVFHEKSYWGDPEVFRPERFFESASLNSLDASRVERVCQFGFGR